MLVGLGGLLALAVAASAPFQEEVCDPHPIEGEHPCAEHQIVAAWLLRLVYAFDKHEGFAVGIFTAALFIATVRLWRSTQALAQSAERTAAQQLRAYVSVRIDQFDPVGLKGPRYLAFHITIKNHGQTPALNFAVLSMNREILKFPLSNEGELADLDYPDPDNHPPQRIALQPGQDSGFWSSMHLPPLDSNLMAEANRPVPPEPENHPPLLYCFGTIEYWDVFGTQHWQHFAGMYSGDLSRVAKVEADGETTIKRPAMIPHVYTDVGTGQPKLAEKPKKA